MQSVDGRNVHAPQGYLFFSSAVQFVITFSGNALASGATLPINRGPLLPSASNTARTVVVRKGERNSGCTPSRLMLAAEVRSLASSISPALLTKYSTLLSAAHTVADCAAELICHFPLALGKAVTKIWLGPNSVEIYATHFPSGDTRPSKCSYLASGKSGTGLRSPDIGTSMICCAPCGP